jgi:hypothetical protein
MSLSYSIGTLKTCHRYSQPDNLIEEICNLRLTGRETFLNEQDRNKSTGLSRPCKAGRNGVIAYWSVSVCGFILGVKIAWLKTVRLPRPVIASILLGVVRCAAI